MDVAGLCTGCAVLLLLLPQPMDLLPLLRHCTQAWWPQQSTQHVDVRLQEHEKQQC
jgi:hypothetical protein